MGMIQCEDSNLICENCQSTHDGIYGSGRFCSVVCARGYSTKQKRKEINWKVSQKLHGRKCLYGRPFSNGYDPHRYVFSEKDEESRLNGLEKYYLEREKTIPFHLLGEKSRKKIVFQEQNYKCLWCHISSWRNLPLSFHLDHIDGNKKNNYRTNLRVLCPNCHTQTDTYCNAKKVFFVDEDILNLVDECNNVNQIIIRLGMHSGWGYKQVIKVLKKYKIKKFQNDMM